MMAPQDKNSAVAASLFGGALTAILLLVIAYFIYAIKSQQPLVQATPPSLFSKGKIYSDIETKLFAQARRSTFRVIAERPMQGWTGTAFLATIDSTMVVVTAGHVCADMLPYTLEQEQSQFESEPLAVSETTDICFMSVPSQVRSMQPYTLKSTAIRFGKFLVAIGHAFGGRLTQYIIQATGQEEIEIAGTTRIFYSARGEIYPGQSGGPVVDNVDGTAVALNSAKGRDSSFITPSSDIVSEYRRMIGSKK